jgi:hypothetical protein
LYSTEVEKISFLKDVNYRGFRYSDITLFREYQSRLFDWKNKLNFDGYDFFNKKKSYHNLFLNLSPSWLPEIFSQETVISDLTNWGVKNIHDGLREYQGYFIYLYLNWEVFKSTVEISQYENLKHPYEPVFKIISRGGLISFSTDNKFVIDQRTYLKYDNLFQMPSIEDNFLDFIDLKCTDYPNQEKIDLLWFEFNKNG